MFDVKFAGKVKKQQGDKAVKEMLERVMEKADGLAIIFDADKGELMFMSKGMCHHEIDALLHNVMENARTSELKAVHKETKEELEILEKQNKEKIKN